ncbi:hypothetical protein HYY70_04975 [Candidatus Woesearchaeota archaeon]|nr:hypothetical protein [Candidatus Woesearchaeota archaeon]
MGNMKLDIEKTALAVFFGLLLLFIGPASLFDHKLKHDFPFGYASSDSFQHQVRAESIKDAGNFRHEANYISLGIKNAIGRYPPVIYHLAVIFSYATGTETYDAIYFLVFFFSIIGIFVMYFIIREFNKNVALLSLPLALILFSPPLYIDHNNSLARIDFWLNTGFAYGHWPSLLAQSFLIAFAWCILRIDFKRAYILIALFLSAAALSHTSEAIFGVIFLLIFLGVRFVNRQLTRQALRNLLIGLFAAFVLSLYYMAIFMNTWAIAQPWSFNAEPVWKGNPGLYLRGFGALLLPILAGIVFSFLKFKELHGSLIFAFSMLLAGFLNYIGFGLRSFQIRFFWPVYLSVFFGFGVYVLLKSAVKKWNVIYTMALCIVFAVLFAGVIKLPLIPHYGKLTSQGIMDAYHWSALKWLGEKSEQNAKVYFMYGDIYSQDALLRNSKRVHYQVVPDDFVKALQSRRIKRSYTTEMPGDSGGLIAVRKGLLSFEYPADSIPQENFYGPQDICSFEYVVFDKASRQPVLAQFNLLIASELLKNARVKNVFENEVVVVLKNSKAGDDCIEERNF